MSFILITVIAQFINSVVALVDKFLVTSKQVPKPQLYVFYSGIFAFSSILVYMFDPFLRPFIDIPMPSLSNVTWISLELFALTISSVFFVLIGLYFMYRSFCCADASDAVPVISSVSAFFTLLFSTFVLGVVLTPNFFIGFVFLVVGTLFISRFRFDKKTMINTLLSGLFFSLYAVLLKILLDSIGFDNGFFWFSIMLTVVSLFMLFSNDIRSTFRHHRKSKKAGRSFILIFGNKLLAGLAGILIVKATADGDVSIVQAMGGLQFIFLFLIAAIVGPYTHVDLGENIGRRDLYQKLVSVSIIFIGFVLLFI